MEEYYIRIPGQDESRGPFDTAKLLTLVEAGQVQKDTLFYDEEMEDWIAVGLNEKLCATLFPERKKLNLKAPIDQDPLIVPTEPEEERGEDVSKMLAAAEGDTEETRHRKDRQVSMERAASIAPTGLGLIMLLSAIFLGVPHITLVMAATSGGGISGLLDAPFLLVCVADLFLAFAMLLAVTDLYPVLRFRAMLTLGFGAYFGWSLGDPVVLAAFALGGLGLFAATVLQRLSQVVIALVLGIAGHALLAYFSISGRFEGFFETLSLNVAK